MLSNAKHGPIKQVHLVIYEAIDKVLILKAALKTTGVCSPSGFDAKNWHRTLVSKSFRSSSLDLRKSFANFARRLCNRNLNTSFNNIGDPIEAFIPNCLIPLNKNPITQPFGVWEVTC